MDLSREFSWKSLSEPENLFWPAYFWYWNGPPTPDVLRRQLADMAGHDARGVCVVPMPHEFRPVTMNASMDVDYLSPEFFQRVKVAVDEAARLGMHYWLYDEGDWARHHGLASGGHLGGEDETFAPVSRGFGSVMRPLRAMDVPGVDVIWRQLWPGKENHHFPKFASSAAHQNGTALAFTESFGVYGNGLTPAQMKWLVDYQYVRGLTLLVCGVYPLSTRDHLMLGERPHFGRVNPLWDFLPDFHRYVARLGYLLSCGKPAIEIGLYYPVRDLWRLGSRCYLFRVHTHRPPVRHCRRHPRASRPWNWPTAGRHASIGSTRSENTTTRFARWTRPSSNRFALAHGPQSRVSGRILRDT